MSQNSSYNKKNVCVRPQQCVSIIAIVFNYGSMFMFTSFGATLIEAGFPGFPGCDEARLAWSAAFKGRFS